MNDIDKIRGIARVIRSAVIAGNAEPADAAALLITATITYVRATTNLTDDDIHRAMCGPSSLSKPDAERVLTDILTAMVIEKMARGSL